MRINVYAEEMTDRLEIITKEADGRAFTGLRFYLELPVTHPADCPNCGDHRGEQLSGPFIHRPGDDDSSAVTFWGKRDLRELLKKALAMLDSHYNNLAIAAEQALPEQMSETKQVWSMYPDACPKCGGTENLRFPTLGGYAYPVVGIECGSCNYKATLGVDLHA